MNDVKNAHEQMEIHLHMHIPDAISASLQEFLAGLPAIKQELRNLSRKADIIMASQTEQAAALKAVTAQVAKAKKEIIDKVAALEAQITAGGASTPEVDAAMQDLKDAVQGVDDLNPDAPPVTPAP